MSSYVVLLLTLCFSSLICLLFTKQRRKWKCRGEGKPVLRKQIQPSAVQVGIENWLYNKMYILILQLIMFEFPIQISFFQPFLLYNILLFLKLIPG